MPKLANSPAKEKRVGLSLTPELFTHLAALANAEGKAPAAFAREILEEYLESRADEVAEAMRLFDAYQQSLKDFRSRKS